MAQDPNNEAAPPSSHLFGCTSDESGQQVKPSQLIENWHLLEEHIKKGGPAIQEAFRMHCLMLTRDSHHVSNSNPLSNPFDDCMRKYLRPPDLYKDVAVQTESSPLSDVGIQTEMCPQITGGPTPAPSFSLTQSEFSTIIEALTSSGQAQKLRLFQDALDVAKDLEAGSENSTRDHAEAILTHYLQKPDSSKGKLLSALQTVGLTLPAELISLSSKK